MNRRIIRIPKSDTFKNDKLTLQYLIAESIVKKRKRPNRKITTFISKQTFNFIKRNYLNINYSRYVPGLQFIEDLNLIYENQNDLNHYVINNFEIKLNKQKNYNLRSNNRTISNQSLDSISLRFTLQMNLLLNQTENEFYENFFNRT